MNIQNGKKNRCAPSPNNNNILTLTLAPSNVHRHSGHNLLSLILLLNIIQTAPLAISAQQLLAPAPVEPGKRSVAGVMVVVAVLFFISGFLSLYIRQCGERIPRTRTRRLDLALPFGGGNGRRHNMEPRGLNPDVIESFPTFLYATVKGLMVGKEALACAVCLDEFQDDETLRLIPICSHVFHPDCIDPWLASNSTCPVCRANLVPRSEEVEEDVSVEIPEDGHQEEHEHQQNDNENENSAVIGGDEESPKESILRRIRSCTMNDNRNQTPPRSRSTGFLFGLLFPRSDSSAGHSVERCERFSVRLPEEVRRKLVEMNSSGLRQRLKRARSCVSLGRMMGSGRSGYRRTRSSVGGRWWHWHWHQHLHQQYYEPFQGDEEQWGFPFTTPLPYSTPTTSSPVVQRTSEAG